MKIFLLLLSIFLNKSLLASEKIYESNFFEININTKNIEEDKNREIEKVKILSLDVILNKILNKKNINNLKKKINLENEINYLIKNIIIENEFISNNKYSAKVKINFDKIEIIELFRKNKINYSDLESSDLMFVVYENNSLSKEGLSKNNSFYKKVNIKNYDLLNFIYPDLSLNDRFILPYNEIENINLSNFNELSKKYQTNYLIIVKINTNEINNNFDIYFYSSAKNEIVYSSNFNISNNIDYLNQLLSVINDWWKNLNIIDQRITNKQSCFIKNSNIHELYFIISKIKSISQIKSFNLLKINLGMNLYDIIYYGDTSNFFSKLDNKRIKNYFDSKKDCILSLKS